MRMSQVAVRMSPAVVRMRSGSDSRDRWPLVQVLRGLLRLVSATCECLAAAVQGNPLALQWAAVLVQVRQRRVKARPPAVQPISMVVRDGSCGRSTDFRDGASRLIGWCEWSSGTAHLILSVVYIGSASVRAASASMASRMNRWCRRIARWYE